MDDDLLAMNRGQRGTKLVRDQRQEVILDLFGLADLRGVLVNDDRPGVSRRGALNRRSVRGDRHIVAARIAQNELLILHSFSQQCTLTRTRVRRQGGHGDRDFARQPRGAEQVQKQV